MLIPNPLSSLQITSLRVPAFRSIPNSSPHHFPLLIYHSAFPPHTCTVDDVTLHLVSVGVVEPAWVDDCLSPDDRAGGRIHSRTHEVLVVVQGRGVMSFGGPEYAPVRMREGNSARGEIVVQKGDVVIIPAGVVHWLEEDLDGDFEFVGAYPLGLSHWDSLIVKYEKNGGEDGDDFEEMSELDSGGQPKMKSRQEVEETIRAVAWFERDPIYGDVGPVVDVKNQMEVQKGSNGR
ncbi:hypothetical protein IAR50_000854 [Cryptococcus sp. DSM 104548]